jgi:hypothetical protein
MTTMKSKVSKSGLSIIYFFIWLFLSLLPSGRSSAQTASAGQDKPYMEEWVYRVKYGFKDEWWKLFQKYQLAVLNKEKELGYVSSYIIYEPGLHASEESRWDYQLIIIFKNRDASTHASEIEMQLFRDREGFKKEENRRWELTANHWDLPIQTVDPGRQY